MRKLKPIRVTSVLSFVDSAWKEYWFRKVGFQAADKISKDSSQFGTNVHTIVGSLLTGRSLSDFADDPAKACASAILDYLSSHNITPLFKTYEESLEVEVKDEVLGLIGHFDLAGVFNGESCIIDFKTSKEMRKSFPLQEAAYAVMTNKQFGTNINLGITLRSHWNPETQKVEFEPQIYKNLVKRYWPKFRACLIVWQYFNRVER